MKMKEVVEKDIEKDVIDVNDQFIEFLHTKGIKAKFKLAFENMANSAKAQHEKDVAAFNEVKRKSAEENKEFVEFLHTKGFKAKVKLVIENIKKGAKESRQKTKEAIEASKRLATPTPYSGVHSNKTYSASELLAQFNAFLQSRGLDSKYTVTIEEIGE